MNFNPDNIDRVNNIEKTDKEERIIDVYHRTSKLNAQKILESGGFRKSAKGFYGLGVYTVEDLESTLTGYAKKHYGNAIVRCEISYEGYKEFIRFQDSVMALDFAKLNSPEGMIYPNKNDGNVVFIKDIAAVKPVSYSVNGGKDWRSV